MFTLDWESLNVRLREGGGNWQEVQIMGRRLRLAGRSELVQASADGKGNDRSIEILETSRSSLYEAGNHSWKL
jgi:hypothetical protein